MFKIFKIIFNKFYSPSHLFPFLKTIKDELEAQKKKEKILGVRGYGWFNLKLDHFFFLLYVVKWILYFSQAHPLEISLHIIHLKTGAMVGSLREKLPILVFFRLR